LWFSSQETFSGFLDLKPEEMSPNYEYELKKYEEKE
jgi:hypothetical protein